MPVMEGGPPGSPCRRRTQTTASCGRSKALVVSVAAKGPPPAGQVCDEKTSMSKPLLTHRKPERWHRNRGCCDAPGQGRDPAPVVRGLPACRPDGARCIGGVSSSQALVWNGRTLSPPDGNRSKWVSTAPRWREGDPQAARTARGRVPGGTGAGRPVVAMKAL